MNSNPLDSVLEAHKISTGCFKIAQRAIKKQHVDLFNDAIWPTKPNALQAITQTRKESDDLFVLALWATFERFVIGYLQSKGAILQQIVPTALANPIYEQFNQEVEYWKQDDILDLLKKIPSIDKNLIGQARTILRYRNWVAHGKDVHKKSTVNVVAPVYAYRILNEIVNILLSN